MHIELSIVGGHALMGTDAVESMDHKLTIGNNFSIGVEPDTRAEADRLFASLSAGGQVVMPMQDMFWGAYWGRLTDKFGVQWMINCRQAKPYARHVRPPDARFSGQSAPPSLEP